MDGEPVKAAPDDLRDRHATRANHQSSVPVGASPGPRRTLLLESLFWVSMVAAVLPVVVAAIVAIRRGYLPIGDNAFFAIRARDVFSSHRPLLGTWTSASLSARTQFNNPGPLLFDFLAPTTRAFDSGSGLVVGVAVLNSLAVVGIGLVARRRGGLLLAAAAMAVVAALTWTMGSAVLIDPTQPSSLILPFLCFCMLVWAVACGDALALPFAAAVGSLVLQSYVTYGYLIVALGAWAVIGLGLHLRRIRPQVDAWPAERRRVLVAGAITLAVSVVCWAQPLYEQFTGNGDGNLTLLLRAAHDPGLQPLGFRLGTRLMAKVVALPPWWVRPSFKRFLTTGDSLPSLGGAVSSLAVVVAVLAACAWFGWRRHDREGVRALATAGVLLAAGLVTAGRMPVGAFNGPTSHTFRWLWPLSAFVVFAGAASLAGPGARRLRTAPLVASLTVVVVVLAALNLVPSDQGAAVADTDIPVVRDLRRQMADLEGRGPLLVDLRGVRFGSPYGTAVLAELQRRSISFVTEDRGLLYQVGFSRRFTGRNASARLLLREGDGAERPVPGARRVALHRGLTGSQRHQLATLEGAIARHIQRHGLRLNRKGRAALRKGEVPPTSHPLSGEPFDGRPFLRSGSLLTLVDRDLLDLEPAWRATFRRYVWLQSRSDSQTVALFVAPIGRSQRSSP